MGCLVNCLSCPPAVRPADSGCYYPAGDFHSTQVRLITKLSSAVPLNFYTAFLSNQQTLNGLSKPNLQTVGQKEEQRITGKRPPEPKVLVLQPADSATASLRWPSSLRTASTEPDLPEPPTVSSDCGQTDSGTEPLEIDPDPSGPAPTGDRAVTPGGTTLDPKEPCVEESPEGASHLREQNTNSSNSSTEPWRTKQNHQGTDTPI